MKKLFYFVAFSMLTLGVAQAHEGMRDLEIRNPLVEIMISKNAPLTRENIALGEPLRAYTVYRGDATCHTGHYLDGTIITHVDTGEQIVLFHSAPTETSTSVAWEVKKFRGKKYIVHAHNGFYVYSRRSAQFVVSELPPQNK